MNKHEAVWITGVGLATSLGCDYSHFADAIFAGASECAELPFRPGKPCLQSGELSRSSAGAAGWSDSDFLSATRWEQLLLWCSINALEDSGWWERRSSIRIGLVLGIGAEWISTWEEGAERGRPTFKHPDEDLQGLTHSLREQLGITGPATTVAAACASGNVALNLGREWVRRGWVDVCLAGGVDRPVSPMGVAGFGNLSALTRRNDSPETASRPFDRGRDGFVSGEGGTILVLEPASVAKKRNAKVLGEVAGYGGTSDAFHPVMPSTDPRPAAEAIRLRWPTPRSIRPISTTSMPTRPAQP